VTLQSVNVLTATG